MMSVKDDMRAICSSLWRAKKEMPLPLEGSVLASARTAYQLMKW